MVRHQQSVNKIRDEAIPMTPRFDLFWREHNIAMQPCRWDEPLAWGTSTAKI
jgi:hypothetical protein